MMRECVFVPLRSKDVLLHLSASFLWRGAGGTLFPFAMVRVYSGTVSTQLIRPFDILLVSFFRLRTVDSSLKIVINPIGIVFVSV